MRIFILNDLFVDPGARLMGAGTALLQTAGRVRASFSALRLVLSTEVNNVAAQSLYEKLGGRETQSFARIRLRCNGLNPQSREDHLIRFGRGFMPRSPHRRYSRPERKHIQSPEWPPRGYSRIHKGVPVRMNGLELQTSFAIALPTPALSALTAT